MSGVEVFLAANAGSIAAAGTALAAFSAVQQGRTAAAQAGFQSDVQAQQAEIARQQAERERIITRQREEDFRRDQSRVAARGRATAGVSGVESGSGSPLLTSEDFAEEVEVQALRLRSGGDVQATRLEQLAGQREAESGFFRKARGPLRDQGLLRGGALLLRGAGAQFA